VCGEIGLSLSLNVWIWFVFQSVMLCVIIEEKDGLNLITGANNFNTNSSATLKRAPTSITEDLAILLGKCINKRSHNSASIFLYIPVMFRYMLFQ
jgi:hypothetical protein